MTEHNGNFSPEEEARREKQREKMRRYRANRAAREANGEAVGESYAPPAQRYAAYDREEIAQAGNIDYTQLAQALVMLCRLIWRGLDWLVTKLFGLDNAAPA